jgi:hypothetical protein
LDHDIENQLLKREGVLRNRVEQGDATATDKNELHSTTVNLNSCATSRLRSAGFTFIDDLKDRDLSKKFIIQGTVTKDPFSLKTNEEGIKESRLEGGLNEGAVLGDFNDYFNGLYGWGSITEDGEGFGYAPPPGITSVTVKYLNKGAVTESTINVKLYNKRQFQLFDILYLRPGFSLLLEFGWTQYLHSENPTEIVNADLNTEAFIGFIFKKLIKGLRIKISIYNFGWIFAM